MDIISPLHRSVKAIMGFGGEGSWGRSTEHEKICIGQCPRRPLQATRGVFLRFPFQPMLISFTKKRPNATRGDVLIGEIKIRVWA